MALVYKDLNLDLSKVPDTDKDKVKKEVSDLLYNEILRYVGQGKSPVQGEPTNFKTLNKKYADREKQGSRKPNLQLEGDLMRVDFDTEVLAGDTIRIGHFKRDTADTEGEKADGHNQHTAKAQAWAASKDPDFPRRRYIPNETQTFRDDILKKVGQLVGKYEVQDNLLLAAAAAQQTLKSEGKPETVNQTTEVSSVGISDFLDDDFIAALIGDRLNS